MDESTQPFRVIRRPGTRQLIALLRNADVVHFAGPVFLPFALALLLRKPVVLEHHGFQAICPNGQMFYEPAGLPCPGHFMAGRHRECLRCTRSEGRLAPLKLWALTFPRRLLCRFAAVNVAPTDWLAGLLALPRCETVHHGLSRADNEGASSNDGNFVSFAFQGRLVSTKGAAVILAAAARLKSMGYKFELTLIGDGPKRQSLAALAHELQIEDVTRFTGYLSQNALENAISRADVVLMPSLGGEVFGLVALENMLRQKLVVVSRIGALEEVLGDAGLACKPGDVQNWADTMEHILREPTLRAGCGSKARERAKRLFSEEEMIRGHMQLYERALSR